MDINKNDKCQSAQDQDNKSTLQYISQTNKKKKVKDISSDVSVNFKYENFEPEYNRFHWSFRKSHSKFSYENVDILDQNRYKFILNDRFLLDNNHSFDKKCKSNKVIGLDTDNYSNVEINRPSNYSKYSYNSNSQLKWDDIWFVIYYSVDTYQCAICLEKKLICPVITRCGHIFCWPCLVTYYEYWTKTSLNKKTPDCPLCKEKISMWEIKFCEILQCVNYVSYLDYKYDEKFEKNNEGKNYCHYNTNSITFNLIMKNKKAPTIYNIHYDPDLEYYKKHLHQKEAFNFIPLENQEEFSFSRIFISNPKLKMKRYEILKKQLEEALNDELNFLTDDRMVQSYNICIEKLDEKMETVKKSIEYESEYEEVNDYIEKDAKFEINQENSLKLGTSSPILDENMDISKYENEHKTINCNQQNASETLSNLPGSENTNNYSTIEDDLIKNENSNLNLKDFIYFFQEEYGDIFYLHPINYDILLAEYTDEQHLPTEITVNI